jgi:hypothetical protein
VITIITPTGGRQQWFTQCEHYIRRQVGLAKYRWIVVDDCEPRTQTSMNQHVIYPPWIWKPGVNTQLGNIGLALELCQEGDKIFFIEDDDWYSRDYIFWIETFLQTDGFWLAGEWPTRYYHPPLKQFIEHNAKDRHESALFQSAILLNNQTRQILTQAMKETGLSGSPYFDTVLWRLMLQHHPERVIQHHTIYPLTVGIKGLPGRPGLSFSHLGIGFTDDAEQVVLRRWLGVDARVYAGITDRRIRRTKVGGQEYVVWSRSPS